MVWTTPLPGIPAWELLVVAPVLLPVVLRASCDPALDEVCPPVPAVVPLLPRLLLVLVLPRLLLVLVLPRLLPVPVLPLPVLPMLPPLLPLLPMPVPLPAPPFPIVPVSDAQPASAIRAQASKVLFFMIDLR
jgi:hypothetical protein